jgi:sulfate permease, SulP family
MQISGKLPLFRALQGWRPADLPADLIAGLTLAAVAVPEQIATARLGGFAPEIGFFAFIAGTLGFALFGASRTLSVGADSTITPIFAGGLALLAMTGSPAYAGLAALLALMVGGILMMGGLFRLGWIANLLSVPVTTGFLAGIAIHILVSQLPALLGLQIGGGDNFLARMGAIAAHLGQTNIYCLLLGLGVFAVTFLAEKISPRTPGALAGLVIATLLVMGFHLGSKGVTVLGVASAQHLQMTLPKVAAEDVLRLIPLALIISIVVMVQTAATTRAFAPAAGSPPDVNRDFVGVGAGSLFAGLLGAFPVNASPPRTAVVSQSGRLSQISGLAAALIVGLLVALGPGLLAAMPTAAFAGILLFIAQRITRLPLMVQLYRQSKGELALVIATFVAITFLPIQIGVAAGVCLSVLQGVWTVTRTRVIEFARIPGTSVWWPPGGRQKGEKVEGVLVLAFQAPLSFLNAYGFRSDILAAIRSAPKPLRLIVLEASNIVEIDFTASQLLADVIAQCRTMGIGFVLARLESVRGQEALDRFGISQLLGEGQVFRSVEDAVDAYLSGQCSGIGPG